VTVVLGARSTRLAPLLQSAAVSVVVNAEYEEGIASSIRTGIAHAPSGTGAVMILLAEQFAVTVEELRRLVTRWEQQPDRIVAVRYGTATGAPAIFPSGLFPELAALRGDRGARSLPRRHLERVVGALMPSAALDVDTPADLGPNPTDPTTDT
jgi:molybdenum cofactor cytidylyltransferase